jgi:hypothetical protein
MMIEKGCDIFACTSRRYLGYFPVSPMCVNDRIFLPFTLIRRKAELDESDICKCISPITNGTNLRMRSREATIQSKCKRAFWIFRSLQRHMDFLLMFALFQIWSTLIYLNKPGKSYLRNCLDFSVFICHQGRYSPWPLDTVGARSSKHLIHFGSLDMWFSRCIPATTLNIQWTKMNKWPTSSRASNISIFQGPRSFSCLIVNFFVQLTGFMECANIF